MPNQTPNQHYENKLIARIIPYLNDTGKIDGQGCTLYNCPVHNHSQPEPDLVIRMSDEGYAVWFCYGRNEGGGVRELYERLGLELPSLKKNHNDAGDPTAPKVIEAEYIYNNLKGEPVHKVIRYRGKQFLQKKWVKDNQRWEWGTKEISLQLYKRERLEQFKDNDCYCYVVEGEKDVDRLTNEGLLATCNSMGAGSWRKSYVPPLRPYDVIIIPDNDEIGKKHAEQVANSLYGNAKSVKILDLPNLPDKGDVSDWLESGHTVDELQDLAAQAPDFIPRSGTISQQSATQSTSKAGKPSPYTASVAAVFPQYPYPLTDAGNAEFFTNLWNDLLRYCPQLKLWLIWDDSRWQIDEADQIMNYALKTVRQIQQSIPWTQVTNKEEEAACHQMLTHAIKSESTGKLKAMLEQAQSKIWISFSDLDRKEFTQWFVNCKNGMINLEDGSFGQPDKSLFITRQVPVEYDPGADCPLFEKFINDFSCGRAELNEYIQQALGASILGNNRYRHLYILHGQKGKNGKSTLMEMIAEVLGPDYACKFNSTLLVKSKFTGGEELTPGMARLKGKRFVYASELDEHWAFNIARIKEFTGEDTLSVNPKNKPQFEFVPEHTPWVMTNPMPKIDGTDKATFDRIKMIPCDYRVPDGQEDMDLKNKLRAEASGIFNWLLEGCAKALSVGMADADCVRTATIDYQSDNDPVGSFLNSEFVISDQYNWITTTEAFEAYNKWGEGPPMDKRHFRDHMNRMHRFINGVEVVWEKRILTKREGGWRGFDVVRRQATPAQRDPLDIMYDDKYEENNLDLPMEEIPDLGDLDLDLI